jgi:hypothetical protein
VKIFGLSFLGAIFGYAIGLFGGIGLVYLLSSNAHDKDVEAVMTGFFATGPLTAVIAFVATAIYLLARRKR